MYVAFLPNPVIEFADECAGLNPGGAIADADVDGPQIGHVEDDEVSLRNVRDALVIVAAAADLEVDSEFLGAFDGGADLGLRRGGDDCGGFGRGGEVETAVSNV